MGDLEGAQQPAMKKLMRGEAGDILAIEKNLARAWLMDPGDDVEERRLACTIGADEAGDRAFRDGQGRIIHGMQAAEIFMEMLNYDHGDYQKQGLSWAELIRDIGAAPNKDV